MLLPVTAVKHSLEGRNIDGKLLYVLIWTLKKEATKPASLNFLQEQARFDKFIEVFDNERPHEALDMKCPGEA
jgi:hypothetical protein